MERLVASALAFAAIMVSSYLGPSYVTAVRNDTGAAVQIEIQMESDGEAKKFGLPPGATRFIGFSPDAETSLSVGVRPRGEAMSINRVGYYTPGALVSGCDRIVIRSADELGFDDCGPLHLLGALQ